MVSVSMAMSLPTATKNLKTLPIPPPQSSMIPARLKTTSVSVKSDLKTKDSKTEPLVLPIEISPLEKLSTASLAAMTAFMVLPPEVEAAGSGVTPSLNNFLLSIGSGGLVLGVIFGAVIGVSYFDPVKRT